MDATDEDLVQRCQRELPYNTQAFGELIARHEPNVFRTCLRYLSSPHDAEDAGQEVFMRVFHGLKGFRSESTFQTWLFRIVVNVCLTRRKRLSKERQQREEYREAMAEEAIELTEAQAVKYPMSGLDGPIGEAVGSLADGDRSILILRYVSELSMQELADALEISLSAAKMRLSRAQQRLKDAYEKQRGGS